MVQAVIVTLLALLYIVVPDVSAAFWMLSAIAAQIYLTVYIFMFLSALRLRQTQPNVKRGFVCPAIKFWATLGLIAAVFALLLGFVPPSSSEPL